MASALLSLPPPASPVPPAAVTALFTAPVTAAALAHALAVRTRRADTRAEALAGLGAVLADSPSAALRLEALRSVAPVARGLRPSLCLLNDLAAAHTKPVCLHYSAVARALVASLRLPLAPPAAAGEKPAPVHHCRSGHQLVFGSGRPYRCDLCSTSHPDAAHWWCAPCDYDACHSCIPPPAAPGERTEGGDGDAYWARLLALNILAQRLPAHLLDAASAWALLSALWDTAMPAPAAPAAAVPGRLRAACRALFLALAHCVLAWAPGDAADEVKARLLASVAEALSAYTRRPDAADRLDDTDALDLLALLHLRPSPIGDRLLAASDATLLRRLAQLGTPRVKRLALRLLRRVWLAAPPAPAALSPTVAAVMGQLGTALLASQPLAAPAPAAPAQAISPAVSDESGEHVVIVYAVAGLVTTDFVKAFARASLPGVRAREVSQVRSPPHRAY